MKQWRKSAAVLCAIALATSFAGCNLVKVDEEKDQQQIVATVNGTEITKDRYQTSYDNYDYQMQMYGSSAAGQEEYVLDSVIEYELLKQVAEEQGYYNLSEERQAEFDAEYDEYIGQIKEYYFYQTAADELGESATEEEIVKRTNELFDEDLAAQGFTGEDMRQDYLDSSAITWMQEDFMAEISVTDEEVQTWYDTELEAQKEAVVSDPSMYEQYLTYNPPALYVPEGYRDIKHILIAFDEDASSQLTTLTAEQDAIVAEMAELMRDEQSNAVKIDELRQQNNELVIQMDELKATAKAKAEEVLEKVKAGGDFDELSTEYSDDTGSMASEDYLENGMRIGPQTTTYVAEFTEAALELNLNQVSDLVETSYGYHILKNINNVAEGAVPLADVKEDAEARALSSKQGEEWAAKLEEWKSEADIVKYLDLLTDNSDNYVEDAQ